MIDSVSDYDALPDGFHQLLTPPEAEPPFEDPGELRSGWGELWGADDEVGRLRKVMVRAPGDELDPISAEQYRPELDALVDPAGGWYWTGPNPPDIARVREQHRGLVETLAEQGIEVLEAEPIGAPYSKSMYVRDPLVTVRGGAIIGRLAPRMRRGEEAVVTREVTAAGLPVLATITGRGTLEGGSFSKLRPGIAAFGTSVRCNDDAADQLREILGRIGWELIVVPLPGFVVHLDIHFAMVDVDLALVNAEGLPYTFMDQLGKLGIECIWAHPQEPWALNLLTLAPGRILTSESAPRTAELLRARGIEVITIPYDEIHHNGGGIHCSTMELLRDPS